MEVIKLQLMNGYSGTSAKCRVFVNDVQHVLEVEELERVVAKAMTERGYKKDRAPRQQYERIIIND